MKTKRIGVYICSAILGILLGVFILNISNIVKPDQEEYKMLKTAHAEMLGIEREISQLKQAEKSLVNQRDKVQQDLQLVVNALVELGREHEEIVAGVREEIGMTPQRKEEKIEVFATSYNPEVGQTDNSPCVGAHGTNVCELARRGVNVLAVSQDLVGHNGSKLFTYGEIVRVESEEPGCNGIYQIEDTMNKRFKMRADIFKLDRKDNISCDIWIMR